MLFSFSGCENINPFTTELDRIEFIRVVGIDKSPEKEGYIRLSFNTKGMGGGPQTGSTEIIILTMYAEGATIAEAAQNFTKFMDREPYWGHLEYVLISEEIAKEGILKHLDWFFRKAEVRLNARVFVVKGQPASEVIAKGASKNKFLHERLQNLVENQGHHSILTDVDLIEIMYIENMQEKSLCLTYIEMINTSEIGGSYDSEVMEIKAGGLCFFDGDRLAGYLDEKKSRGVNWLRNELGTGILNIHSPSGSKISSEFVDKKVKIIPKKENGKLSINIKIMLTVAVTEIQSTENIFKEDTLKALENQISQEIKNEVEDAIKFAQKQELDFIGMGGVVYRKYPIEWQDIYKDNWKSIFPKLKISVEVDSKIRRTYNIRQPIKSLGDEEK